MRIEPDLMRENKYELPATPPPPGETGTPLTRQESREIVTPYAFAVCPNLLGVPTAHPLRRAIAMGIDGIIISGLAKASLLLILPVMTYLIWFRLQAKKFNHVIVLLLVTAFLAASATWMPELIVEQDSDQKVAEISLSADQAMVMAATALKIQAETCELSCMKKELERTAKMLRKAGISKVAAVEMMDNLVQSSDFPPEQWPLYRDALLQDLPEAVPQLPAEVKPAQPPQEQLPWYLPDENTHSVVAWVKGIFADLGIGVGWAVFYFTATIAWCHGQTIGKKLMRIKVIQLDGKELNLLAAFSRQGGYGAGIATGLLGFLQVLWDPNRQAIQDKVASTVVIRLGKEKRPLTH
jgi:uncharacterized RDD family membrane protein YckC